MSEAPRATGLSRVARLALVFLAAALGAAGAAALFTTRSDREQKSTSPYFRVVELDETSVDSAVWGRNFPVQYESFRRNAERGEAPGGDGDDPRLRLLWAGRAGSFETHKRAGHASLPGAAASAPLTVGLGRPVSCIDCHDPKTQALRVTRPSFIEGLRQVRSAAGEADYDVNHKASHAEMRTYVCAQCHAGVIVRPGNDLPVHPWARGLGAERILEYDNSIGHADFTHTGSGAALIDVRSSDFEMWSQGIHARSGVSCADCHMPYMGVRGVKVSDHHVRSPLLDVNRTCQTCHRSPEGELVARVRGIQETSQVGRRRTLAALEDFISNLAVARGRGATDQELAEARRLHSKGHFLLAFVLADGSMGFHAPLEASRLLDEATEVFRQGRRATMGKPPLRQRGR